MREGHSFRKVGTMPPKPRQRHTEYPWDKWFARRSLVLVQGKDFACQVHGMSQQIRNKAAKRGIAVAIDIVGRTLQVGILSPRKSNANGTKKKTRKRN